MATKKCPYCAEEIQTEAIKCRYCGSWLGPTPPPGWQPPTPPAGPKRLTRSCSDRMLAGICGGLAQYANVDPTLVRVLAVMLTCLTAVLPGLLMYLVLVFVIPSEDRA